MNRICRHGFVHGRVQGVSFRQFMQQQAQAAGLDGWVRNRDDGRVEFLLCGEENAVHRVLKALRQGPPLARVDGLDSRPCDESPPAGFRISG